MFCRRFVRFLLTVVVLFGCGSVFADSRSVAERQLRIRLDERIEQYLETVRHHPATDNAAKQRELLRARSVVERGLSRLRGDDSAAVNLSPTDSKAVVAAFRQLDKPFDDPAIHRAAEFLGRRFHVPTQRDIVVFLAIPDRAEQARILGLPNGFPKPSKDDAERSELQSPFVAGPAHGKNFRFLLALVHASFSSNAFQPFFSPLKDDRRRIEGYPAIAQTTLRRE